MSVKVWDSALQAYRDVGFVRRYDRESGAWADCQEAKAQKEGAWQGVWPERRAAHLPLTDGESFSKLVRDPAHSGTMVLTADGVAAPSLGPDAWAVYDYICGIVSLNGDFEFSAYLHLEDSTSKMGDVSVLLLFGESEVAVFGINDAWAYTRDRKYWASLGGMDIYGKSEGEKELHDGHSGVFRAGGTVRYECGGTSLGSIQWGPPLVFDRIRVRVIRHRDYTLSNHFIRDIYVGPPRETIGWKGRNGNEQKLQQS